jgi:hypothetical protein
MLVLGSAGLGRELRPVGQIPGSVVCVGCSDPSSVPSFAGTPVNGRLTARVSGRDGHHGRFQPAVKRP